MLEENQVQTGFQPERQINSADQQSNLVQNQQPVQGNLQQNNTESEQENLRSHSSWLNKILTGVYFILGFGLIFFGINDIFETISRGGYYFTDSIPDIIINNGIWALFLIGICFILIGIKKLFHSSKLQTSLLIKIVSRIFSLLGIALIGLGIYGIFETQSDWHYFDYTFRDIIMNSGIFILGPLGIWFILIGVLSYHTPNVDLYYHPTRLTKTLSGIYRFLGITLIWSGLWNFSLIGTENLSFLKILYVGGVITLCGILYIFLGRLLYNSKSKMHLGFSMLCALIINVIFARILRAFTEVDEDIFEFFGIIIVLFTLIYFSILTIRWIIKCRKFNKSGIINPKYLNQTPSKKKVGIIITIILFSLIIINLIYGKIQWSKIPEIDESIFQRSEHQTKLPDEEDALVQLRAFYSKNTASYLDPLDSYYLYQGKSYNNNNNKDISWKLHTEECIIFSSGGNEYCGTWVWNRNTLDRVLNNYYYVGDDRYLKDFINSDGYLSVNGEKVTVYEFIDKNEHEIRVLLKELDRIASLDYYLPNDEILNLVPVSLQGFSRASMVALQYYIYQEDWEMAMFIIKLNYKFVDIFNDSGGVINQLISMVLQNIVDSSINSYMKLFPKDFTNKLSQRYPTQINDTDEIIGKMIKGEYVMWNWAKTNNIMGEVGKDSPSLFQFLFHFPFYSEKDVNRLMNYSYYQLWQSKEKFYQFDANEIINNMSIYNMYGRYPWNVLAPRVSSVYDRINKSISKKESLIKFLESGNYDVRFSGKYGDSYEYENNRIPTDEELFENKIKEYSDITNPCFGRNVLDSEYNPYYTDFGDACPQTLLELTNQEDDEFGLKEILIDITQLYISYNEISTKIEDCPSQNICESVFNELDKIYNKLKNDYIKFMDILENIKNKVPGVNVDDYFYIPEIMYDIRNNLSYLETDDTNLENVELLKSLETIKEYSDIIQPCLGKNVIDPFITTGIYLDEFEKMCTETLSKLKEKEDDDIGLKKILIELTQSLVDYSKFEVKVDACWLKKKVINGSICDKIFDEEVSIVNKVKENYKQLSNVLKNIENENHGINIDSYFYIPYQKIYNENNLGLVVFLSDEGEAKELLNNIELQESIDIIEQNLNKLSTGNKTNEQIDYEKLVILTDACIGENILNSNMEVSYDNFINQCNYVVGELKDLDNSGNFKQLNKNLTFTIKEWIEFANIKKEEDLLFEKDGIILETEYGTAYQNGSSPEWNILFEREDKNLENFKKNYSKLEEITRKIKQGYGFSPEIDFYIPYSVINENTFRLMLRL